MTAPSQKRKTVIHAVVFVVGVSLATSVVEHLGWLDRFETTGLDAFNILQAVRDPQDIVIVAITDADYDRSDLFNATSPLKCDSVRRVIEAVSVGGPTAIGVDLDTSPPGFDCLQNIPADWPPIVWAQDAVWNPEQHTFKETPVLSGGPTRDRDRGALAQLPLDADGAVRRYYRELPLEGGRRGVTFPWAVLAAACQTSCQKCCTVTAGAVPLGGDALRLNFAGERFDFQPLSVQYVLQIVEGGADRSAWRTNGPLTGKIVLIGGTYRTARDSQPTPIGSMNGVKILAQAVESELQGGGIRALNEGIALALDLVAGFLLVWLNYRLRNRLLLALLASLLFIPFMCLVGSLVAFSTLALWFNFVPVGLSVLIHQFYEHAREYQRLRAARPSAE